MNKFLATTLVFSLFVSVQASDDILDRKKYLKSALGVSELPMHKYLIIKDDIEDKLKYGMNDKSDDTFK